VVIPKGAYVPGSVNGGLAHIAAGEIIGSRAGGNVPLTVAIGSNGTGRLL